MCVCVSMCAYGQGRIDKSLRGPMGQYTSTSRREYSRDLTMHTLLSPLPFLNFSRVVEACAIMLPPIGLLVSLAKLIPWRKIKKWKKEREGEDEKERTRRVLKAHIESWLIDQVMLMHTTQSCIHMHKCSIQVKIFKRIRIQYTREKAAKTHMHQYKHTYMHTHTMCSPKHQYRANWQWTYHPGQLLLD